MTDRLKTLSLCTVLYFVCGHALAAVSEPGLEKLQNQWAIIYYQEKDQARQELDLTQLAEQAAQYSGDRPDDAGALVWQAIIISTKARIVGGLDGLHDAEQARDILLRAKAIDPTALHGTGDTSLGVLYYKVPGRPIGFGDDKLARQYLEKGLVLNPDSLDANFFYGDFLHEAGDDAHARTVLLHALQAPPDANRLADTGRRDEVRAVLHKMTDSP